jgi:hypothetical protein
MWQKLNPDLSKISVLTSQGADPPPLPLHIVTAGRVNEEITPLLPTGIGERYCQTISNLGHAALLRRCELRL